MKRAFCVVVLLVGIMASREAMSKDISPPVDLYPPPAPNTLARTIIPANQGAAFYRSLTGMTAEGTWTPSADQVRSLEAILQQTLQRNPRYRNVSGRGLQGYRAQYVGILRSGRQVIIGNYFCNAFPLPRTWQQSPVAVDDGGDCFFQIEFDPMAGVVMNVTINGQG